MTRHRPADDPPAIPDDNAPLPPARRPTRWTVRRGRAIAFSLLGLAVAASLLSVYLTYQASQETAAQAAAVDERLAVLEEDLAERTRQRDAERDAAAAREQERDQELRAQIGAVLCDVLADLPPSRGLDQVRATLGCPQPGTPGSQGQPSETTAASPPGAPAPSQPPAPAPAQPPGPAPTTPAPPSEPPSGPGLLCGLLPMLC